MTLKYVPMGGWALIDFSTAGQDGAFGCWTDGMATCMPICAFKMLEDGSIGSRMALCHLDAPNRASLADVIVPWINEGEGGGRLVLMTRSPAGERMAQIASRFAAAGEGPLGNERVSAEFCSQRFGMRFLSEGAQSESGKSYKLNGMAGSVECLGDEILDNLENEDNERGNEDFSENNLDQKNNLSNDLQERIQDRGYDNQNGEKPGFLFATERGYYRPPAEAGEGPAPEPQAADIESVPVFEGDEAYQE